MIRPVISSSTEKALPAKCGEHFKGCDTLLVVVGVASTEDGYGNRGRGPLEMQPQRETIDINTGETLG